MGLLSMLGFHKAADATPGSMVVEFVPGDHASLEKLNADMLREYHRSTYLWRSVDMIATMASSVPLIVAKPDNQQLPAAETRIGNLLERPNPQWTGASLQHFMAMSLAVTNEAFIRRIRGVGDAPIELWPLVPGLEVRPVYHQNSRVIDYFEVTGRDGLTERVPVDPETGDCDVIYIRRPALSQETNKSPAAVASPPSEVFNRILQRCADILGNSSNITGVLSTEDDLGEKALHNVKSEIDQYTISKKKSGGILVVANAKWDLTRLSEDPSSALDVKIKDSIARDVCMTLGVPSQLVGIPGADTYNNLNEARVGLFTDTVMPGYINLYVAGLNHALMRSGIGRIKPDVDRVPSMMAFLRERAKTIVESKHLTINEMRVASGYPPIDDAGANVPVLLREFQLREAAIAVQGGNVQNILPPRDRSSSEERMLLQ